MTVRRPHFRHLDPEECTALLARHHVGRLAYTQRNRIDIVPIHYVLGEGWLYGRTAAGHKLEVLEHNRWVAFEVDEIEGAFDWMSVVVKGGVYLLRADGSEDEIANYRVALDAIRTVAPFALTPEDPVPERAIIFRIHIDEMQGRAASTR